MNKTIIDGPETLRNAAALQSYFLQTAGQRLGQRAITNLNNTADGMAAAQRELVSRTLSKTPLQLTSDAWSYIWDAGQRNVLMLDILRQWSDQNSAMQDKGAAPSHVLIYENDIVMSGRDLPLPCNYYLLRIKPDADQKIMEWKRPYVIIDPRRRAWPRALVAQNMTVRLVSRWLMVTRFTLFPSVRNQSRVRLWQP